MSEAAHSAGRTHGDVHDHGNEHDPEHAALALAARDADPTGLFDLKERRYRPAVTQRYYALRGIVRETLIDNDALRLGRNTPAGTEYGPPPRATDTDRAIDVRTRGDFGTDVPVEKQMAFLTWFQRAQNVGVVDVLADRAVLDGQHYTSDYVRRAYLKAIADANKLVREHSAIDVFELPGVDATPAEARAEGLDPTPTVRSGVLPAASVAIGATAHREMHRAQRLNHYRALEKVASDTNGRVSRLVRSRLEPGRASSASAYELVGAINGDLRSNAENAARAVAHTETANTYNQAVLTQFEQLGIDSVAVQAETVTLQTAGDDSVCTLCEPLHDAVYSISEARGVLPRHPYCRCRFVPRARS